MHNEKQGSGERSPVAIQKFHRPQKCLWQLLCVVGFSTGFPKTKEDGMTLVVAHPFSGKPLAYISGIVL